MQGLQCAYNLIQPHPGNLPQWASSSAPDVFLFSLAGDGIEGVAWAVSWSCSISWVFPMYTVGIHVIKVLLVFLLLICLFLLRWEGRVLAKNLEV